MMSEYEQYQHFREMENAISFAEKKEQRLAAEMEDIDKEIGGLKNSLKANSSEIQKLVNEYGVAGKIYLKKTAPEVYRDLYEEMEKA